MLLTRRSALKNLIIISGGIILIPSCIHQAGNASIPLKNISLNADDEKLLGNISDVIIPPSETPGAKALLTHIYAMKMIDDCYDKDHQQQFVKGLKEVNDTCKKDFNNDFNSLSSSDKEKFLNNIQEKKYSSKDLISFYGMMKHLTIDGYMTSKYVGTNIIIYELVPGRFHGSFPINKNQA